MTKSGQYKCHFTSSPLWVNHQGEEAISQTEPTEDTNIIYDTENQAEATQLHSQGSHKDRQKKQGETWSLR
jgi:hypothetical protein